MLAVVRVVTISVPACSTTVEESNCLCELPAARLLSVRKCRRGGDNRTIVDGESRVSLGEEVKDPLVGELGNEGVCPRFAAAREGKPWLEGVWMRLPLLCLARHASKSLGHVLTGAMRLRLPATEPCFAAKHFHTRPLPCVLSVAFPARAARVSFDESG